MKLSFITALFTCSALSLLAQIPSNITVTDPDADRVLKGNYNPTQYLPGLIVSSPAEVACALHEEISTDSLYNYLMKLGSFHNRNTYADTLSNTTGIGAARKWVYSMFQKFSSQNQNRLLVSYLQFEMDSTALCGSGRFKNIFAVLPGADTSDKSIIIIEVHIDSRCEDVCDINCLAEGIDDNGSGTALVLELARVLSGFGFSRTIVFLVTVGEEQGLTGAEAFAKYADDNGIGVKAVQNNDIVGGIFCGETSSPPSCPAEGDVDSTQLRIFSLGTINSPHKSYARFTKLMYGEWLLPKASVPMIISIMQPEDRTNRGGDHQPFRQHGFTAVRFTSANEHGNGNPADSTYHDRQHSTRDILGVDTDSDSVIDSFFVDLNYLARNTAINGIAAAMAAAGPYVPTIQVSSTDVVTINDPRQFLHYRVGVRTTTNDFDVIYTLKDSQTFTLPGLLIGNVCRISAAAVNNAGVMSLFSNEVSFTSLVNTSALSGDTLKFGVVDCNAVDVRETSKKEKPVRISVQPNPFSNEAIVTIVADGNFVHKNAVVFISDVTGRRLVESRLILNEGSNPVLISARQLQHGVYFADVLIDGIRYGSLKIVYSE